MPYGSIPNINFPQQIVDVFTYGYGTKYSSSRIHVGNFPAEKVKYGTRSGSNSATLSNLYRGNPRPLIQVQKILYNGPRTGTQTFVPRLNRWIWTRAHIVVYKTIKDPATKRRKSATGMDLPSNALLFNGGSVRYFGLGQTVVSTLDDYAESRATGDLWWNFTPLNGGGTLGPNAQGIIGTGIDLTSYAATADEIASDLLPILYEKVKNQDVNLAVALAEFRQSANLFISLLTRAGHALLKLKKGNLTGAAGVLFPKTNKELANDWLLFQYGVKPLLSDIDGAAKALAIKEPRYFDIVVRRKRTLPLEYIYGNANSAPIMEGTHYHTTQVIKESSVEVKYKVRVKIATGANVDRELTRLGFGNLNAVAWEVIPYSFIIDWVLPIGDYLNNMDAFTDLTVVSCHKTVFIKETITWMRRFGGGNKFPGEWQTVPIGPCGFVNEKVYCNRTVGIPIPELPPPGWKNPFSTGHFLNSLALFFQLKKR